MIAGAPAGAIPSRAALAGGEGGTISTDLTGSGRADLGYLLENIVDPSAIVPADFRLWSLTLGDGRVLSGLAS